MWGGLQCSSRCPLSGFLSMSAHSAQWYEDLLITVSVKLTLEFKFSCEGFAKKNIVKIWGNDPGDAAPCWYFCLTYLNVSVKSHSFYGNNSEKGPSGPLSDDRNERSCSAIRHFKMAGANIHWVFETGFLSFLKTGVRIFEIYCLNTCLSAQNSIV